MRQFTELMAETLENIQNDIKGLNTSVKTLREKDKELENKDKELENKDTSLSGKISDYWKTIYPVGAIYVSVSSTSPATLFGGTWEQIEDTFLLASGSTYSAGSTGGEATHKLTVNEMPSHTHEIATYASSGTDFPSGYSYSSKGSKNKSFCVATGGGAAHNNMPPYLAVFVWKRTE
jgi:hypothetical protein